MNNDLIERWKPEVYQLCDNSRKWVEQTIREVRTALMIGRTCAKQCTNG
ncbi:MAG TPA: hypothetical protein VEJ47_21045 [Candidatus Eremiobacteraceae bacterium]|nr:hypothetical protein [Candidatus Eremiobacteraceae bacterium]